jgi:hypothetical protein
MRRQIGGLGGLLVGLGGPTLPPPMEIFLMMVSKSYLIPTSIFSHYRYGDDSGVNYG